MLGFSSALLVLAALTPSGLALPTADIIARDTSSSCPSYVLINTRGTGEKQGESSGFYYMNQKIIPKLSGGSIYNTVYPAGNDQNTTAAIQDIIREISTTLASNSRTCFILQGYSQGAAATVQTLPRLSSTQAQAVKGVFLIGDPLHKSGLTCNVDSTGGTTTRDVNGDAEAYFGSIPSNWVSKSLDVCAFGDGVCDTKDGNGVTKQHLSYPSDQNVQNMGYQFAVQKLGGTP